VVPTTDKNSPKTSNASSSTTVTKTDNKVVTGGAGFTAVGGNTDLSNIQTGPGGSVNVTTTDQGAIAAGLRVALAGIDSANSSAQTAIQSTAATASDLTSQAIGVAQSVAQGQQNTTIKYIVYAVVAVAAVYFLSRKS